MINVDLSKNAAANLNHIQEALSNPIVVQHLQELRTNNLIWLIVSSLIMIISIFFFLGCLSRAGQCDDSLERVDYMAGYICCGFICVVSLMFTIGNVVNMVSLNNHPDLHAANFIRTFK